MTEHRWVYGTLLLALLLAQAGCSSGKPSYGREEGRFLPGDTRQVWAVAPVVNLSGQRGVDPLLQADLLYQQLQQVQGLSMIPVNRVVEVYATLGIDKVQSEEQAAVVCDLLGCDGLVVGSVTLYDPYNPPKMGAALQLFRAGNYTRPAGVDPRDLVRSASPPPDESLPADGRYAQVVEMYDAANGSVRQAVLKYAQGRHDPVGPYGADEYFMDKDRYAGFVYYELVGHLLRKLEVDH